MFMNLKTGKETVKNLKEIIFEKIGKAIEERKLDFSGTCLGENALLSSYSTEEKICILLKKQESSTQLLIETTTNADEKKDTETIQEDTLAPNEKVKIKIGLKNNFKILKRFINKCINST
jgi:hypothetical protein